MSSITKQEINKDVTLHVISHEDEIKLRHYWNNFKGCIEYIIKRDSLPNGIWLPSEDFKTLIKQG